jgi:hypothetical protein
MATTYDIGDVVRVSSTFTDNATGVAVDPGQVRVKVRDPQNKIKTYTYLTHPEVVRVSAGIYRIEFKLTKSGGWYVRFEGNNTNVSAEEALIEVRPSQFYKGTGAELPDTT